MYYSCKNYESFLKVATPATAVVGVAAILFASMHVRLVY